MLITLVVITVLSLAVNLFLLAGLGLIYNTMLRNYREVLASQNTIMASQHALYLFLSRVFNLPTPTSKSEIN